MLPPLPRCSGRAYSSLKNHPSVSAFPDSTIGSACTSSFSRFARRSLALRPAHSRSHLGDRYPRASDISSPPCLPRLLPAGANRRVGLAPTGKAPPCHGARGNRSFRDRRDPGSEFNNFGKPVARKSSSKRGGLCLKHVPPRHVRLVLRLTYDGDAVNNRWRKVLLLRDARYGKTPVLGILKSDSPGGLPVRRIHPPLKLLHGLELQY